MASRCGLGAALVKGGTRARIRLQFGATSRSGAKVACWYTNMTRSVAQAARALVVALAASGSSHVATASEPNPPATTPGVNPYSELTDQQWTEVVARWEHLDGADRRWFLTEVRKRKAHVGGHQGDKRQPFIEYRRRARFGHPTRPLEAELRHAHRSSLKKPSADDENRYGLGFEQRHRERLADGESPVRSDVNPADAAAAGSSAGAARERAVREGASRTPEGAPRQRQPAPAKRPPASSPRMSSNTL